MAGRESRKATIKKYLVNLRSLDPLARLLYPIKIWSYVYSLAQLRCVPELFPLHFYPQSQTIAKYILFVKSTEIELQQGPLRAGTLCQLPGCVPLYLLRLRADSGFAPGHWETLLQSNNAVSNWLSAGQESRVLTSISWRWPGDSIPKAIISHSDNS